MPLSCSSLLFLCLVCTPSQHPTAPATCPVKTENFSMPSWKKIPFFVKGEYKIYLLDKFTLRLSPSPYTSHPDKWWQWIGNNLEWTVQTKLGVVRIWWSCLLPAPKVMRISCSPRVSTKATSGAAAGEERRADGIFLSSPHSHPCQSKTNLN